MILSLLSELPRELYVFVISIFPLIELRGAVPIGATLELPLFSNIFLSVLGNMLPIPFILLLLPKLMSFLGGFKLFSGMVNWLREKAESSFASLLEKARKRSGVKREGVIDSAIFIALMLFVALPLPGTGAWSAALVAAIFNLNKRRAFISIFFGVLICGVIMALASYGIVDFLLFLAEK